ncbi:hypothetical protein OAG36_00845 [bacterium]|nr:hypothetical protein [bacterium]
MATNSYFNNYGSVDRVHGEQDLIEDLVIESIKMFGLDCFYIPRSPSLTIDNDTSHLFSEDDMASYRSAHPVEMYIKNVEGFEGEGDFLSKFGLEIRDSITFTIAQKRYRDVVAANIEAAEQNARQTNTLSLEEKRPLEGDLLYFPLNKKIFQITFVEHEAVFYQMGSLQTFDLKCELFEYSNDTFVIPEVPGILTQAQADAITAVFENHRTTVPSGQMTGNDNAVDEATFTANTGGQNSEFENFIDNGDPQIAADNIIDFSQGNPFGDDIF